MNISCWCIFSKRGCQQYGCIAHVCSLDGSAMLRKSSSMTRTIISVENRNKWENTQIYMFDAKAYIYKSREGKIQGK